MQQPATRTNLRLSRVLTGGSLLTGLLLSACTAVTESSLVDVASYQGCSSGLGSYTLPRTYLRAKVERVRAGGKEGIVLAPLEPVRRPDNDRFYCLDHLANPFATDEVSITKATLNILDAEGKPTAVNRPTQYLGIISSAVVDQTSIIIRKLIRAVAIGITKNANFMRADTGQQERVTLAVVEFDPFDPEATARANADLRRYGFCVALESFSFNTYQHGFGAYCNNPLRVASDLPAIAKLYRKEREAPPLPARGIYYRPRAHYRALIFTNAEPDLPGKWKLAVMQNVALENLSPVLAVKIDRSTFAQRRMALVFDQGALVNVCLYKGSEALGFMDIPLEIVRTVVTIPIATMQVRYEEAVTSTQLFQAEQKLIELQRKQIDYINKKNTDILAEIGQNSAKPKLPDAPTHPKAYTDLEPLGPVPAFDNDEVLGSDLARICNPPGAAGTTALATSTVLGR